MGLDQGTELPMATYQLAEQYQVGQPLTLHNMRPEWVRFYRMVMHVILAAVICIAFFCLVVVVIFLYQYLILLNQHFTNMEEATDLQGRFILSFPGIITALISCVGCMIGRYMIAQNIPVSLFVCTEGLLEIRPKGVNVTYWGEVRGTLQGPGLKRRKSYKLARIKRKPLFFGEAFEDLENLVNLIRQHTPKE